MHRLLGQACCREGGVVESFFMLLGMIAGGGIALSAVIASMKEW